MNHQRKRKRETGCSESKIMFSILIFLPFLVIQAVNRSVLCEPVCVIRITDTNKHCHSMSQWKSDLRCRLMQTTDRLIQTDQGIRDVDKQRASVSIDDQVIFITNLM